MMPTMLRTARYRAHSGSRTFSVARAVPAIVAVVGLLVVGTLGVVDHDHAWGSVERAPCVDAHEGGQHGRSLDRTALGAAAEGHEHDCLACHNARSRSALLASMVEQAPVEGALRRLAVATSPRLDGVSWSLSARGPPRS